MQGAHWVGLPEEAVGNNVNEQVDLLVIAAHPDDAEFGAGGTVAAWTKGGKKVVFVICTNGDKGTSDRDMAPERLAEIREGEQREAARTLGVRDVVFLRYPDQGLEETSEFRKQIVRQIRIYRPHTVATSDPYQRYISHRDHRITGQVVLDAVYPFARDALAFPELIDEGLEPHSVREVLCWGTDDINYRSDITDTFDLKAAALRCHASQMGGIAHALGTQDLEGWLRPLCEAWAEGEDFELAEAFHRVEVMG
jgi:LmbE family N-acetylglucosaminyl deacetylase